jgi:hypothetical protein
VKQRSSGLRAASSGHYVGRPSSRLDRSHITMIARIRRNLSFANVVSMLALLVALGGTSYAATALPDDSVDSAQIKASAVKNSELGPDAVTTGKVKDATLVAADFAPGELPPKGPKGDTGATGAIGPQGIQGPAGILGGLVVHRVDIALPAGPSAGSPGTSTSGFATCPAGQNIVGGSASIGNVTDPPSQEVVVSRPSADDVGNGTVPTDGGSFSFWKGTGRTLTNVAGTMRVFVYCAAA